MERKEKMLLTEIIQDGARNVSECIGFLGIAQYVDELGVEFEQSVINGLRVKLTQFLADGGSETHSKPYMSEYVNNEKLVRKVVVYLANFAGVKICWKEHTDCINSYVLDLFMVESHVVL